MLVRAVVPEMRSNKLFLPKLQAFSGHSDWSADAMLARMHLSAGARDAAAAGTAAQGSAPRRAGPCQPAFQTEPPEWAHVLVRHAFASLGPKQPLVSRQHSDHVLVQPRGPDVMEKEKKCRLGTDCALTSDSEQGIEPPWALIANSDGPGEDVIPFLPRFLLQEIIFARCPFDDLYPNQSRFRGNFLCGTDRLQLRGIAGAECVIRPIREITAHPRCSTCERPSSGARTGAIERIQLVARTDALVWKCKQSRQPLLWAIRQYLLWV